MTQIKNKKTNKISLRKVNLSLIVFGILIYLAHLVSANDDAAKRYELSQFRGQEQDLILEKQNLSVRVAELQSLDRLVAESVHLNLVKAPAATYITVPGAVALKN